MQKIVVSSNLHLKTPSDAKQTKYGWLLRKANTDFPLSQCRLMWTNTKLSVRKGMKRSTTICGILFAAQLTRQWQHRRYNRVLAAGNC